MESDIIFPMLQRKKLNLRDTKCIAQDHTVINAGTGIEPQDPLTGLHIVHPR